MIFATMPNNAQQRQVNMKEAKTRSYDKEFKLMNNIRFSLKTCIITALIASYWSCLVATAADRFIIKYKLSDTQNAYLSEEQLAALSKAANNVQVIELQPLATGAHVIALDKDLDEAKTKKFIRNVEQDSSIDYIEENEIIKIAEANSKYQ